MALESSAQADLFLPRIEQALSRHLPTKVERTYFLGLKH